MGDFGDRREGDGQGDEAGKDPAHPGFSVVVHLVFLPLMDPTSKIVGNPSGGPMFGIKSLLN
jgi:hypothetical protein